MSKTVYLMHFGQLKALPSVSVVQTQAYLPVYHPRMWAEMRSVVSVSMSVCLSCSCSDFRKPWPRNFISGIMQVHVENIHSRVVRLRLKGKLNYYLVCHLFCTYTQQWPCRKLGVRVLSHYFHSFATNRQYIQITTIT